MQQRSNGFVMLEEHVGSDLSDDLSDETDGDFANQAMDLLANWDSGGSGDKEISQNTKEEGKDILEADGTLFATEVTEDTNESGKRERSRSFLFWQKQKKTSSTSTEEISAEPAVISEPIQTEMVGYRRRNTIVSDSDISMDDMLKKVESAVREIDPEVINLASTEQTKASKKLTRRTKIKTKQPEEAGPGKDELKEALLFISLRATEAKLLAELQQLDQDFEVLEERNQDLTQQEQELLRRDPDEKFRPNERQIQSYIKRMNKRGKILTEFAESERAYNRSLHKLLEDFVEPSKKKRLMIESERSAIFGNVDHMCSNSTLFLHNLEKCAVAARSRAQICDTFREFVPILGHYSNYIASQNTRTEKLRWIGERKRKHAFNNYRKKRTKKLAHKGLPVQSLESFLIMPIQRLMRYEMLLRELLKYTPTSHDDWESLQNALDAVQKVNSEMNDMKPIDDISREFASIEKAQAKKRMLHKASVNPLFVASNEELDRHRRRRKRRKHRRSRVVKFRVTIGDCELKAPVAKLYGVVTFGGKSFVSECAWKDKSKEEKFRFKDDFVFKIRAENADGLVAVELYKSKNIIFKNLVGRCHIPAAEIPLAKGGYAWHPLVKGESTPGKISVNFFVLSDEDARKKRSASFVVSRKNEHKIALERANKVLH